MKKGWTYKKLGEVCDIFGRIGFRGYTKNDLVASPDDGAITLSPSNIVNGEMDFAKCSYITWEKYEESPEIMIYPGDILIVKTASVGKTALVKHLPHKATINPQFVVLKNITAYNQYLSYYLKSRAAQDYIWSIAKGAAAQTVSQKNLAEMIVPIPSQLEQQRIVERLDSAFENIDQLKANAEKQLAEARTLFQKCLAKAMEPKEGWKEKTLKDLVLTITDGDHQPPPKSNNGIPFITISNIDKDTNKIEFGDTFHVPQEYFEGLKVDRIPQEGDVLYTVTGSFGIPVLIDYKKDFCFQRHIALIRPNQEILYSKFLYYWILSDYAKLQAEDTATGAAQRTVSLSSLRKFDISIPSLAVQQRIVERLDSLSENVRKYEEIQRQIISECDALKQALLRKVFE